MHSHIRAQKVVDFISRVGKMPQYSLLILRILPLLTQETHTDGEGEFNKYTLFAQKKNR